MSDSAQAIDKGNESGPAFPNPGLANESCQFQTDVTGMTLRDYFAAKAMTVVASGSHETGADFLRPSNYQSAADDAYRMADAMLKARQA